MTEGEVPEADLPTRPTVHPVDWPTEIDAVRPLFAAYRRWLAEHRDSAPEAYPRVSEGLALVDGLLASLPGPYAPPRGDVLLWKVAGRIVACGALRELAPHVGEIRRIAVDAPYRGKPFGAIFVRALVDRARTLGFDRLRVDTLASMSAAIEFYQEAGFRPIPAFWAHPAAGARFFERALGPG